MDAKQDYQSIRLIFPQIFDSSILSTVEQLLQNCLV